MKTSNKILVMILLLILLLGAAVHLTLYARYQSGQYLTEAEMKKTLFDAHPLTAIDYVQVKGLTNLRVLTSDKPSLNIIRGMKDWMHYDIKSDSLFIWGDTVEYERNKNNYGRIGQDQEVDLYLPAGTPVNAAYCVMVASGSETSGAAPDYRLSIFRSRLQFGEFDYISDAPEFFNKIQVRAESESEIRFTKRIDSLSVSLANSSLLDNGGGLGHLALAADDSSTVSLSLPNLRLIAPLKE